ncbi:asparagine synthase (glutamine-hydrolyzing) [Sulfurovum sp.]|uniref:asparagine synthase (glutamine-hydrolyzing) n=1 Tax=Sulfurovum sp. TaxID=1969726 RepID=UPI002867FFF6|nr:asparagine synthase (glutamine-hydrolyzing) [Sulfurovum sp.]
MCGIVGIIDYQKKSSKALLTTMTNTLHHRGPDDGGYAFMEKDAYQLGFGHRRLSILDLSSHGHQPMTYEHLTVLYNGEIYNFQEIKKELEILGYVFESHSDTEVILKAFCQWGIESVHKFRGMFAFAMHDSQKESIYIFRDRVGVKPLYYYRKKGLFLFGSELKALAAHPDFMIQLNQDALSMYLQFGYIHAPATIYEDTHKLLPGHYIKYDLLGDAFETVKYWDIVDFYKMEKLELSEEEAQRQLEELLIDSFNLRMVSDVPVGTFLSGGIDSSLVTALLQKHNDEKISTFTIGFEDETYNEAHYAKKIAEYLGTNHTEHYCTKQDTLDIIPLLPQMYDEPFGDSSAIPTALVSKLAKEKVSVVLSGDGGDEVFCGYSSYELFEQRLVSIKKIPARNFISSLLKIIPDPILALEGMNEKYYLKYLKLKSIMDCDNVADMFRLSNAVFTKYDVKQILSGTYHYEEERDLQNLHVLEQMMISDFKGYLADDILVKVDRATMHASLEGREPLLDHKILEFAARLPLSLKKNKNILKNILAKYIPVELFERKKQGFGIPINDWLRDDLKFLVDKHLSDAKIIEQNIFDLKYVQQLKALFFAGKNDDRKIWTLLMFQMWHEENFTV